MKSKLQCLNFEIIYLALYSNSFICLIMTSCLEIVRPTKYQVSRTFRVSILIGRKRYFRSGFDAVFFLDWMLPSKSVRRYLFGSRWSPCDKRSCSPYLYFQDFHFQPLKTLWSFEPPADVNEKVKALVKVCVHSMGRVLFILRPAGDPQTNDRELKIFSDKFRLPLSS